MRRHLIVLLPLVLAATPWILALIAFAVGRPSPYSAWPPLVVCLARLPFVLTRTAPECQGVDQDKGGYNPSGVHSFLLDSEYDVVTIILPDEAIAVNEQARCHI